jgi:hypothetical protein
MLENLNILLLLLLLRILLGNLGGRMTSGSYHLQGHKEGQGGEGSNHVLFFRGEGSPLQSTGKRFVGDGGESSLRMLRNRCFCLVNPLFPVLVARLRFCGGTDKYQG